MSSPLQTRKLRFAPPFWWSVHAAEAQWFKAGNRTVKSRTVLLCCAAAAALQSHQRLPGLRLPVWCVVGRSIGVGRSVELAKENKSNCSGENGLPRPRLHQQLTGACGPLQNEVGSV